MRDQNKHIDELLESKLKKSGLKSISGDFTGHLMKRIAAENKALLEERKSEKIVKYAIGSFSFLMLAITVGLGVLSKKSVVSPSESSGVGFDSVQTSNSFIDSMVYYIQGFFMNVLEFFGVSLDRSSVTIMLVVVLVIAVFMIGERLFLRGKYKSSVQLK